MASQINGIAVLVVAVIAVLLALSVGARTERIARNFKRLVLGCLLGGIVYVVAISYHIQQNGALFVGGVVVLAVLLTRPPRSRYITAREKRKAIARYELSGEKYDRHKHELDHVVPFSKGGNNSADNIRVVERSVNRKKGARPPWWDVIGR